MWTGYRLLIFLIAMDSLGVWRLEVVFSTGSRELDSVIGSLRSRSMLLIVGNPGAGKTTLASQTCYINALNGYKCLYITFYEDKDKLFRNMKSLGIDFAKAEARGLLEYIKLPMLSSAEEILKTVADLIPKVNPRIVVIDSINAILETLENREVQRAILLNFFYQLINTIDGLLIVIAELPFGKEQIDLGAIEFVADVVLVLKHRIEKGLVTRILELRKIRGAPLTVVEIPFSIAEGRGIEIFVPPRPERPASVTMAKLVAHEVTEYILGPIYKGDTIFMNIPGGSEFYPEILIPLVDLVVENDMKTLLITYRYSRDEIIEVFTSMIQDIGLDRDTAISALEGSCIIEPINPASFSLTQLQSYIVTLVRKYNPDFIIFYAIEVLQFIAERSSEYWSTAVNLLTWLKNQGKLVLRISGSIDPRWVKKHEAVADVVIRLRYRRIGREYRPIIFRWRRGVPPREIDLVEENLSDKIRELGKTLAEVIRKQLK